MTKGEDEYAPSARVDTAVATGVLLLLQQNASVAEMAGGDDIMV